MERLELPTPRFWRPVLYQLSYIRKREGRYLNRPQHLSIEPDLLLANDFSNLTSTYGTSTFTDSEPKT